LLYLYEKNSPQTPISLVFGGPRKQVQPTLNVIFLEYRRN
jgi:hypothetical protein